MNEWSEGELIRNEDEMKRPSRVNTRDIRPREAQVSTDYGGKEMRKRWDFNFVRKREVERSEIQEPAIGTGNVEWWAEWRRCEGRLFHNTGAKWKNDLLEIVRPEETEGRLSVIRDEERVERWGVRERRERRWDKKDDQFWEICEWEREPWIEFFDIL